MVRVSAAIAAAVLAVLLALTIMATFEGPHLVTPTGGITNGPQDTLPTGQEARQALRERTELQRWRAVSGPSPGAPATEVAVVGKPIEGSQDGIAAATEGDTRGLLDTTQEWLARRDKHWEILYDRDFVRGQVAYPYEPEEVFVQAQGRDWRRQQDEALVHAGGWIIFGIGLLLALFLLIRGRIRVAEGFSGRLIERFNALERANHWITATSFLLLAITGLVLLYGKIFLKPLLGAGAYSALATGSAYAHVAFMVPFVLGVVVMIVLWTRQNLVTGLDMHWLARFGGFLSRSPDNPPARRFNAGQKLVFWGVVIGGILLTVSGITLLFPFFWLEIEGMQWTLVAHAAVGLLMIGLIIGHIYIGTVGMEDAFNAMWSGEVDRNWLKEHHVLWLAELEGRSPGELKPSEDPGQRRRKGGQPRAAPAE